MENDPTASRELAANLKEFESPGLGGFEDIIAEVGGETPEPEAPPATPEPKKEKVPEPKEEKTPEPKGETPKADNADDPFADLDTLEETPEEDPVPANISKAGKEDWEKLRQAKSELKTQLETNERKYVTEIEELKKQVAEVEELREKAKFIEEAEHELALTRVEATREYKETVGLPLQELEKTAMQIAKSNGIGADKVFDALAEPDAGRRRELLKEVTEEMDDMDTNDLLQMARDTQRLLSKQAEIRERAAEAAKETSANAEARKTEEARKARQRYEKSVSYAVEELSKRIPFIPDSEGEKKEEVYAAIERKVRELDFEGETLDKRAEYAASRALLPRLAKQLRAAQEKIETLESRVDSKRKNEPKVGKDAPSLASADDYEGDVDAAVAAALGGSKQRTITDIYMGME